MTGMTNLIRTERLAFIDLLTSLDEEQWHTPSLCSAWTVENVAAHLAWAPAAGLLEMAPVAIRAAFRTNRMIADAALRWTARGRPAILDQLRHNADHGAKPLGMPQVAALTDAVVHGLDVRVPLGLPHNVEPETFVLIADWTISSRWPVTVAIGGSVRRRLPGVRLIATNADWAWGNGVERRGRTDEILLWLTGRDVVRV
jgi:uncharacterized protein (TIGR03083 family)